VVLPWQGGDNEPTLLFLPGVGLLPAPETLKCCRMGCMTHVGVQDCVLGAGSSSRGDLPPCAGSELSGLWSLQQILPPKKVFDNSDVKTDSKGS